jgi:hypothetical protein
MHYKNGREAKNGDKVIVCPSYGAPYAGILYDAVAGNDCCNGKVAIASPCDPCPNLKECLHVEDATKATGDVEARAGVLYDAYCANVGGVAFNGDPLPNWETFRSDPAKLKQVEAWRAIASI